MSVKIDRAALRQRMEEINAEKEKNQEMLDLHLERGLVPLFHAKVQEDEAAIWQHCVKRRGSLKDRGFTLERQIDEATLSLESQDLLAPYKEKLTELGKDKEKLKSRNALLSQQISDAETGLQSQMLTRDELQGTLVDYVSAVRVQREAEAEMEAAMKHRNARKFLRVLDRAVAKGPSSRPSSSQPERQSDLEKRDISPLEFEIERKLQTERARSLLWTYKLQEENARLRKIAEQKIKGNPPLIIECKPFIKPFITRV